MLYDLSKISLTEFNINNVLMQSKQCIKFKCIKGTSIICPNYSENLPITDRLNSFNSLTLLCLWGFTGIKMRLQWNHLNMWGPIFVDYGFFCFVLFFAYLINFVNGKTQRFSVRTK